MKEGEQLKVDVKIPRLPTGVLKLVLQSRPSGLEIRIDDAPVDPSEWDRPKELDAGAHTVVARAPGYDDFTFSRPIEDGERADVDVALTPAASFQGRGTPKWLFFGVAGLSLAVVGGGTYIAIQAKSKSNTQKALDPLERDTAERDKVRTMSTQANVLFVAGGALAVGAGVLFFTTRWKGAGDAPAQSVHIVPWVVPGAAGLASSGSF